MSKELDQKLWKVLKETCANVYCRPTNFSMKTLEDATQFPGVDISHSLNNLQRSGMIRIHMASPGETSRVELLRQE